MSEFQVLHEVGEFNLQQPDNKLTEADQQKLKNDQAKNDHSENEGK